jgi:FMN-dependent dehydrogenase
MRCITRGIAHRKRKGPVRLESVGTLDNDSKGKRHCVEQLGDFQNLVYAEAGKGVTTRYPFDFASIERKASQALPDWVYRYVSAAAGDGRTQRANIAAFSCYGIAPPMMVSPPERDLSIRLFGKHFASPMFSTPIDPRPSAVMEPALDPVPDEASAGHEGDSTPR